MLEPEGGLLQLLFEIRKNIGKKETNVSTEPKQGYLGGVVQAVQEEAAAEGP